jgi:hypothetical protein
MVFQKTSWYITIVALLFFPSCKSCILPLISRNVFALLFLLSLEISLFLSLAFLWGPEFLQDHSQDFSYLFLQFVMKLQNPNSQ